MNYQSRAQMSHRFRIEHQQTMKLNENINERIMDARSKMYSKRTTILNKLAIQNQIETNEELMRPGTLRASIGDTTKFTEESIV